MDEPTTTARRSRLAAALPLWLRRERVEILLFAFREGRAIHADALTAVLGAKHDRSHEPFAQWSAVTVQELVWADVAEWCAAHQLPLPPAVAETVWTVLDHRAAGEGFGPRSDPLPALRAPLIEAAGLDARGRRPPRAARSRRRHPSASRVG